MIILVPTKRPIVALITVTGRKRRGTVLSSWVSTSWRVFIAEDATGVVKTNDRKKLLLHVFNIRKIVSG